MPKITDYPTLAAPLVGDEWVPIVATPGAVPTTKKTRVDAIPGQLGYLTTLVKGADTARANTVALAADPDLVAPLAINTKYVFEMGLYIVTAAAPDWQHQLYFPAGASSMYHLDKFSDAAVDDAAAVTQAASNVFVSNPVYTDIALVVGFMLLKGSIVTAGNAGNFGINWAQGTSSATTTSVKAGSWLRVMRATA